MSTAALLAAGLALLLAVARPAAAFDSGRAAFSVIVNNELVIPYRVFAVYVLPGERLRLLAAGASAAADGGMLEPAAAGAWDWTAPAQPGVASLTFEAATDRIRLNALILHPASTLRNGRLNGYTIGSYPAPLHGEPVYRPPIGYIELTAANADLALSPHFRLDQFPSKQSANMPKYLALREALLLKLELLLERVNEKGIATDSFVVMSGFRTPFYNRAIGNVQSSRHIYGGAADIFSTWRRETASWTTSTATANSITATPSTCTGSPTSCSRAPPTGACAAAWACTASTPAHGPFLHIDARGARARWGLLP